MRVGGGRRLAAFLEHSGSQPQGRFYLRITLTVVVFIAVTLENPGRPILARGVFTALWVASLLVLGLVVEELL